jgi:hypothetical protein
MIGQFGGFISQQARNMAGDPWAAMGVLDDIIGPQNAKMLMPIVAYSAGKAPRGEKLAELSSGLAGLTTFPWMTDACAAGLRFMLMPSIGGPVGKLAILAGSIVLTNGPNEWLRKSVFRSVRTLQQFGRKTRHLEMGGNYRDTETSQAWRLSSLRK